MAEPTASKATGDLVRQLSRRLQKFQQGGRPLNQPRIPSGCPLDRLLPGCGFAEGSLVEWLAAAPGSGAVTLALLAARQACRQHRALVVVDREQAFYPPAAAAWGIDLERTILVHPHNDKDEFWAMDQVLRSPHVAAVLAWPQRIDSLTFRRLQLAVEHGGGLGLLVRSVAARHEPSWADVRLLVSSKTQRGPHWHLCVQLLRCRGRFGHPQLELEIDEQTGKIHEAHPGNLAAKLARATSGQQSAQA